MSNRLTSPEPQGRPLLQQGRYVARFADGPGDLEAVLALRAACFRAGACDRDPHDDLCRHVLVEERATGRAVCAFRLLPLPGGDTIGRSYSACHYDLAGLSGFRGPMMELGRFCIDAEARDADVLRVAWGAMSRCVDAQGVRLLFGCSSFEGTEAARYVDAFSLLRDRHLAPTRWLPRVKAPDVVRFARGLAGPGARDPRGWDPRRAIRALPPLLRTYLAMGGWVSDHAVVDRDLGTLHVFTGLEVASIPPARARALRAVAG